MSRAAEWERATADFHNWPQVGVTEDGEAIRRHEYWGTAVREPSGYVCSPIAYSVRRGLGVGA